MTNIRALPLPATVGNLYNVSSWTTLADFTPNGCTASVISNKIRFSGGANTFTQSLDLSSIGGVNQGYSLAEKWSTSITFTVPTTTSTSYWIGVGKRCTVHDLILKMSCATGSIGVATVVQGLSHIVVATAATLTMSPGDSVSLTLTRNLNYVTYDIVNLTQAPGVHITATFDMWQDANNLQQPNRGRYAIFNGSTDNIDVTSYSYSNNEYVNPIICNLGDSKTAGFKATAGTIGFAFLLKNAGSPTTCILGGPGDQSTDFLACMYELINLIKPKYMILWGISNDLRNSISPTIWKANVASIVSQCVAAGIIPIISTGLYETSISQAAFQTEVNTNYTQYTILDYVDTVIGLNADGVHPNDAGHLTYANTILASGKLPIR
jgi:hypothetical protein